MNRKALIMALAAGLLGSANAGVLNTYTEDSLGTDYLLNEAALGGADLNNNTGNAAFSAFEMVGLFNTGDDVSVTGIVLPLWSNNLSTMNNTLNGTFTFTFYGLAGGGDAERFDGLANETELGSATLDFSSEGTAVDLFGGLFDSALNFTADSSGFAVRIESTANFRMKLGPQPSSATRININNGNRTTGLADGNFGNISILGTAVPAPSSVGILAIGGTLALRRRR